MQPLHALSSLFGKKKSASSSQQSSSQSKDPLAGPDPSQMTFMQRLAWKQFQGMSPEKQRETVKKVMTPENIKKHRGEILQQLDAMRNAGMLSQDQYRLAKRRMGLDQ